MNKLILALALVLAPFFSEAESIFTQENTVPPVTAEIFTFDCFVNVPTNVISSGSVVDDNLKQKHSYCLSATKTATKASIDATYQSDTCYSSASLSSTTWEDTHFIVNYTFTYRDWRNQCSQGASGGQTGITNEQFKVTDGCTDETHNYPVDTNSGDAACADPDEIPNFDTCNDGDNTMLQNRVSVSTGCFSKPDGSICKYNAVDVGGGIEAYALDPEGNCYSDPEPDIVGENNQLPNNNECADWGSTGDMVCGESPQDVCSADGSSCQDGCGTLNGETFCFSGDQDGDGLPNYLDPDKDGDGIPNKDDLDSDGDGKDDEIDNTGKGDESSGGGGGSVVDLRPVVSKLEEINKSISETDVTLQTKPTEELAGFWETEYEDGLQGVMDEKFIDIKATSFFTFIETLAPTVGGGSSAKYDMCFDLGGMGSFGCHNFNVDPRVFPAIKVFILILAGFLCRRILFGG